MPGDWMHAISIIAECSDEDFEKAKEAMARQETQRRAEHRQQHLKEELRNKMLGFLDEFASEKGLETVGDRDLPSLFMTCDALVDILLANTLLKVTKDAS